MGNQPVVPSTNPLPKGLQREFDAIDRRAQDAKTARQNGVVVMDYIDKKLASRPDVLAMQNLLRDKRGLDLGDGLYLSKKGFRAGSCGKHHRVQAADLRCPCAADREQELEAKLKAYGEEGIRGKTESIGTGHEQRNRKRWSRLSETLVFVSAPLWVPPWLALKAVDSVSRAWHRRY